MPAIGLGAVLFAVLQFAIGAYAYRLVSGSRIRKFAAAFVFGLGGAIAAVVVRGVLEVVLAEALLLAAYAYWKRTDIASKLGSSE
jgi:hypothetical protein